MSFAAMSVFITSSVSKSYQGAAGSLLITVQNLSTATMAAIGETVASETTDPSSTVLDLKALKAVWWFSLTVCLFGAAVSIVFVRIPKGEEKDHVN